MVWLMTAAQMRGFEAAAIAAGTVTGPRLMARAAAAVVAAAVARAPGDRALVLCGPGNNGGDGYLIAQGLAARGWRVQVAGMGALADLPPDAALARREWQALGPVRPLDALPGETDLLVDALFGTGLTRPLDRAPVPIAAGLRVAVDAPSGLCLDSGRVLGAHVWPADLTVTFHGPKPGHYLAQGPGLCGTLLVTDIGLVGGEGAARLVGAPGPGLGKGGAGHKYDHGHALVLSGGVGRGGAARLAARAALRIGAGLVTLGCPPAARIENAARLDAIMLRALAGPQGLAAWEGLAKTSALCLGPGFGLGEATRAMVAAVLALGKPVVLDADALTAFADDPAALFAQLHPGVVLTPHGGEFARLFPDLAARLAAPALTGPAWSKLDATRAAAARAGCTVLFKGADTVIAGPDGDCALHAAAYDRAAPWLATAGAGDVLAGLITGLLARGLTPMAAAQTAAWLHVEAARAFGPGLIAEDLPEAIPGVLRALGL